MKYKINKEQKEEIKAARHRNRDKQIDKRLEVLELRSEGVSQKEIAEKTGYCRSHVCDLIKIYFERGLLYLPIYLARTNYSRSLRIFATASRTQTDHVLSASTSR